MMFILQPTQSCHKRLALKIKQFCCLLHFIEEVRSWECHVVTTDHPLYLVEGFIWSFLTTWLSSANVWELFTDRKLITWYLRGFCWTSFLVLYRTTFAWVGSYWGQVGSVYVNCENGIVNCKKTRHTWLRIAKRHEETQSQFLSRIGMIFKFYRASSFVGMIGKKPSQESLDCQTEKILKNHQIMEFEIFFWNFCLRAKTSARWYIFWFRWILRIHPVWKVGGIRNALWRQSVIGAREHWNDFVKLS